MILTHGDLKELGALLGYQHFKNGLCAGFSGMWVQAVLAKDEGTFYERLTFMGKYKNNLPELVNKIKKAQAQQNKILSKEDNKLIDILAFFDGMALYLSPSSYADYFPDGALIHQLDIASIFYLAHSRSLDDNTPHMLWDKNYSFTEVTLINFLNDLAAVLSKAKIPCPMRLESIHHSVCLKYDSEKSCWHYLDTEDFGNRNNPGAYFRELSTQDLAKKMFSSSFVKTHAVFCTRVITAEADSSLQESLKEINGRYTIHPQLLSHEGVWNSNILHLACQNGDIKLVKEMLKPEYKVDIDKTVTLGATPLIYACINGYPDIVNELLKYSRYGSALTINKTKLNGATPLVVACRNGRAEIVKLLLKSEYKADFDQALPNGKTPFYIACQNGNLEIVKEFLKPEYKTEINKICFDGMSPLVIACKKGHTEIVREILASSLLNIGFTVSNNSLLQVACLSSKTKKNKALFQLLLEHEDNLTHKNNDNQTALDIALAKGNQAAITVILKYAALKKYSLQDIQSQKNPKEAIQPQDTNNVLRDPTPQPVNLKRSDINRIPQGRVNSLFVACRYGTVKSVIRLLKTGTKANINQADENGLTPFFVACRYGRTEIVRELLKPEYHVDINKAVNNDVTPFEVACYYGYKDIVAEILKAKRKVDIQEAIVDASLAFFIACKKGHIEIVEELLKPEYKVNVNGAYDGGLTPFLVACYFGHTAIIEKLLLSSQFKIANTSANYSPLQIACLSPYTKQHEAIFLLLMKYCPSLAHKNNDNQTALDIAFANDNQAAIKILLKHATATMNKYPLSEIMSSKTKELVRQWLKDNSRESEARMIRTPQTEQMPYLFFKNSLKEETALQHPVCSQLKSD